MKPWVIVVLWVTLLLTPFLLIVQGIIIWLKTPKQNKLWGYRTKKTLACKKTWVFANKNWGKFSFISGVVYLLITSLILYFTIPQYYIIGLSTYLLIMVIVLVIPIIIVEIKIKKTMLI